MKNFSSTPYTLISLIFLIPSWTYFIEATWCFCLSKLHFFNNFLVKKININKKKIDKIKVKKKVIELTKIHNIDIDKKIKNSLIKIINDTKKRVINI